MRPVDGVSAGDGEHGLDLGRRACYHVREVPLLHYLMFNVPTDCAELTSDDLKTGQNGTAMGRRWEREGSQITATWIARSI
ncbi:hypothetical protein VFPPC_15826 [Pochonia chlamydosporia 170]|uniref:Uncharacterized protein n=1 Tax=Pochonia chlamydosporia 170 TaxID=1380566 RepID=A0A179FS29_METCM|nr:hypothetical protein VFPPC_15826 [Pochonia chlamydosporia 170]OAQ68446.1 hypothetical protein VFPPC_15826 [Pochonia chlamydosporia 170]